MKRTGSILAVIISAVLVLCTGCNAGNTDVFDPTQEIGVISREEGSGTRGAFVSLFGIQKPNEIGKMIDCTTQSAVITNNTAVMMNVVADDRYAIGYISLGSLNDTVKALRVDGAEASAENIHNGTYSIIRQFSVVTNSSISPETQDFINFIMSADGQQIVELAGYIGASDAPAYSGGAANGRIVAAGSSSVVPVMEKLKEAYIARNPGVSIEIQQSDSSTGIADTADGICDIGLTSRALKQSETDKGVATTVFAVDGIAVIVNLQNPTEELTSEQIGRIFAGEARSWIDIT